MRKKFVVAAVIVLFLIAAAAVWFISGRGLIPLVGNYDLEQDYCGKAIDINYCKCAFQGENCEMIGALNQDAARELLTAGFEQWVIEKKKEECAQKGGEWVEEKCRK